MGLAEASEFAKGQALVRRLVKKTQDGTLGQATDDPLEDDPMAIHIGDSHHIMNKKSSMLPVALAGLVAGGLSAAAVAYFMRNPVTPTPTEPKSPKDSVIFFEIVDPDTEDE